MARAESRWPRDQRRPRRGQPQGYECELKDGRVLSGLLAAESSASITLRLAQGLEEVVPRDRIARLMDRMGAKEGEVLTHPLITPPGNSPEHTTSK